MNDQAEPGCKVCRVSNDRRLGEIDDRLLELWHRDGAQRMGYRKLARWLNVMMLRQEMDHAGLATLGGEAESKYDRLQGDNPTVAVEVRENLIANGIDVENLESDFVSYGVVRTHIKDCLGAERDESPSDWEQDSIEIVRDRAREKIAEAVSSLVNKDKLRANGDVSVHFSVDLECEECKARIPLERALRREYVCHCDRQMMKVAE